jgi:hypothetical protein
MVTHYRIITEVTGGMMSPNQFHLCYPDGVVSCANFQISNLWPEEISQYFFMTTLVDWFM